MKLLSNPGAGPGQLGKLLAKHLGKHVKPATLIKVSNTTRTAGAVSGGLNPSETGYRARGWLEAYDEKLVDGTTVLQGDVKISLLAATIASAQRPQTGDKITIEGTTYRVIAVPGRDPDAAVYKAQARK